MTSAGSVYACWVFSGPISGTTINPVSGFSPTAPLLRIGISFTVGLIPEPEFCWTDGPTALMVLRVRGETNPLTFRARIRIFWPRPDLPPLVISVFANGQFADQVAISTGDEGWIEIPLPRDCLRKDGILYLRFEIQPPRSPRDFGSADDRQLGFALAEFFLEPTCARKAGTSVFGWINANVPPDAVRGVGLGGERANR